MADGLPSASLLENVRFNALVVVPNAAQGIFRRRRPAVAAATAAGVDAQAVGLLAGLARSYDRRPVWVRVISDQALLMLDPADAERALEGSPDPYASDPEAKRKGMVAFQPDALTISRGELWRNRRRFAESVLETGEGEHRLGERFAAIAREETGRLLTGPVAIEGGRLGWGEIHPAVQRIARRVILGDGAAEDAELSETLEEMMAEANGMPGEPSKRLDGFMDRLGSHLERAEPGSLASLAAAAPHDDETKVTGQFTHWLFALGDTLAINALRALALLASHPEQRQRASEDADGHYLDACLSEAMRLWPTTPMLSRETVAPTEWEGEEVPAGTQFLIVNTFLHRDRERLAYADRFAPGEWISGDAADEPAFNHFSRGPQGCPGAAIATLVGRELIATVLAHGPLELRSGGLDPARSLPRALDFFGVEIGVS